MNPPRDAAPNAKSDLRRDFLRLRAGLGPEAARLGDLAQSRLIASEAFARADTIMVYLAFRGEVPTELIVEEALRRSKRVAAPVTYKAERRLVPHLLSGRPGERRPGAYGILEPDPALCPSVSAGEVGLVVVPGVAFDDRGGRLGYGGGYYDRFLRGEAPDAVRAALAFEVQVSPLPLPLDAYDVPMDFVFTEARTILGRPATPGTAATPGGAATPGTAATPGGAATPGTAATPGGAATPGRAAEPGSQGKGRERL